MGCGSSSLAVEDSREQVPSKRSIPKHQGQKLQARQTPPLSSQFVEGHNARFQNGIKVEAPVVKGELRRMRSGGSDSLSQRSGPERTSSGESLSEQMNREMMQASKEFGQGKSSSEVSDYDKGKKKQSGGVSEGKQQSKGLEKVAALKKKLSQDQTNGVKDNSLVTSRSLEDTSKKKKKSRNNSEPGDKSPLQNHESIGRTLSGGVLKLIADSFSDGGKYLHEPNQLGILGFEIANIMVRIITLRAALTEEDIKELKDEVLSSDGVKVLVSEDDSLLWKIAAEDKRIELRSIAKEVIRLSKSCGHGEFPDLSIYFGRLCPKTTKNSFTILSKEDMDFQLRKMGLFAQETAGLYHAFNKLKTMEQNLQRRQKEEETILMKKSKAGGKDIIGIMKDEIKSQEKLIKDLKSKGLWNKKLSDAVGPMIDAVVYLYFEMVKLFGTDVWNETKLMDSNVKSEEDQGKLGVLGLSTLYANVVNMIDGLVLRPFSSDRLRDSLYTLLPPTIRAKVKKSLLESSDVSEIDTEALQEGMEDILDWLVVMAGNTLRYNTERRLQGHTELTLLQTLYHCQKKPTDDLLVQLLVHLNHFVARNQKEGDEHWDPIPKKHGLSVFPKGAKTEGGNEKSYESSGESEASQTLEEQLAAVPDKLESDEDERTTPISRGKKTRFGPLPPEDREKIEELSHNRRIMNPNISKSLQFFPGRKGGGLAALRKTYNLEGIQSGSLSRVNGSDLKKMMMQMALEESSSMGASSPRNKTRSLSRSSTLTSILIKSQHEAPPSELQLRAMTPERLDVDRIGEEEEVDLTFATSL